jgi:pre-rRNA-processing protein IPI3
VQAVSCVATTPYHILTGSEDSNIQVWPISRLIELGSSGELEPDRTLSNHRGAITSLVAGQSIMSETSICISASRDKTCIIWNYQSGEVLRTLLFSSIPTCIALDPCGRALFVSSEDAALFLIELFGDKPLIGPGSSELSSTVVQITSPLGVAEPEAGPASCLGISYDGTSVLSGHAKGKILEWNLTNHGHPSELADLNASVTNLILAPLLQENRPTKALAIVKPSQVDRVYTFTAQLDSTIAGGSTADELLSSRGIPEDILRESVNRFMIPPASGGGDPTAQKQNDELWDIINEQRDLQKLTFQRYVEAKSSRP